MGCDLEPADFQDQSVFRVGRPPSPWRFVDWAFADRRGRFDGRWDDPQGSYRVLYAATSRFGAFVEALGPFRADPAVVAGLAEIVDDGPAPTPVVAPGGLPLSWASARVMGQARLTARAAQVGHSRSLAHLRQHLSREVVRFQLEDLDAAAIRLSAPRAFTQALSRHVYECTGADGTRQFDGIVYRSRFGDELTNVALFETPAGDSRLRDEDAAPINLDDPDLSAAMAHHGLRWHDDTGT